MQASAIAATAGRTRTRRTPKGFHVGQDGVR
jgi:hypothetical protein